MYKIEQFTLPEMVLKGARHYAGRPALSMLGGATVSYDEIEPRSRRIAALLGLLGVKPGERVALLAENGPAWGLAYFGLSRAAAVAVPILTDFSPEQIGNILKHSESRVAFVSRKFLPKLKSAGAELILLAVEDCALIEGPPGCAAPAADELDRAAAAFAPPLVKAHDLAAIVYTSGTTGLSKGVMLTHLNLVWDAWATRSIIHLRRTDRLLSILPLAHTYEFTIGFITPLLQGSSIYYLDRPPSATALLPALQAVRPTVMLSIPLVIEKIFRSNVKPALEAIGAYKSPLLKPLLELIAGLKLKKTFGGRMRFFGVGGAPLAADVEAFLAAARFPYAIGYGLTETAPMLAGNAPFRTRLRAAGPAMRGVDIRIADPRPDTGEGEIQARGPNVTPGYYRDPARTAEIFTADGWFRTGDLGVIDETGRVCVRGRIKTMILGASGENIYPEEVEAVINRSPLVQESLVYGDESGLIALVHLKPEVYEDLLARFRDGLEDAELAAGQAAERLGQAFGAAGASLGAAGASINAMGSAVNDRLRAAEQSGSRLLDSIKKETNQKLAAFSRIARIHLQPEPFEKTPTQKIKRFLYPKRGKE